MRHILILLLLLSILLAVAPSSALTKLTVVRFDKLVDGQGRVVQDAVVIVDGDRISKVSSGEASVPPDAEIIDLRRYTGIPGLIDAHTHITYYWDKAPGTRPWTQPGTLSSVITVFLAQEDARKTLEAGVTTVRDLGSWEYNDISMRERYIEAFRRSDFEAMLNYYKQNYPAPPYLEDTSPVVKVKPPVLLIHGLEDKALMHGALNHTWEWLEKDLTLVTIPGVGHFVQNDAAEFVSGMMKSWLELQATKP